MSQQPIEYRQIYARMFAVRVHGGKLFTDRASEALQEGRYKEALQDLAIARSFYPENEKLAQLMRLIKSKRAKKATQKSELPSPRRPTRHKTQGKP